MNPYNMMDGDYEKNLIVSKVKTMAFLFLSFFWVFMISLKDTWLYFFLDEWLNSWKGEGEGEDMGWSHLTPKAVAG